MKVLLIAYEYPPIIAAQALRWYYLTNELAGLGHTIHVVCPRLPVLEPYPVFASSGLIEHRVWPGPFVGFSQWLSMRRNGVDISTGSGRDPSASLAFHAYRMARSLLDRLLYPDVRSEWFPFARYVMARLLKQHRFDVIISSHEPAVDLFLGLWAKRRFGLPWIVDLADPLCAPYSPSWRQWFDQRVEGKVIQVADRVVLTTDRLREVLLTRHGSKHGNKYVCIPQGAPSRKAQGTRTNYRVDGKMNLVFTGNFYEDFRSPKSFALALKHLASDEIAVTLIGDNGRFRKYFNGVSGVTFIGKSNHFDCLELQNEADVLLNIGNFQSYQIPGKIYEYIGANKPILHIRQTPEDPGADFLIETELGIVSENEPKAIATALSSLLDLWRTGTLTVDQALTRRLSEEHSWGARAKMLSGLLAETVSQSSVNQAHAG